MKTKVINQPLHVAGVWYQPGEEVELEGAPLENLLRDGRVESAEPKEEKAPEPLPVETELENK